MINLVVVDGHTIYYAPYLSVGKGDLVKVHDDGGWVTEGTVTDIISTYEDNELFQFVKRHANLKPVLAVIKVLHYEEEEQ